MKYNTKTAVHVTDEFTRQNLIPFFEAIKSDCNVVRGKKDFWESFDIEIGEIWYIGKNGQLQFGAPFGYTILEGIPENWREEMQSTEERMAGRMMEMARTEIDLESKINQLETENKELKECLNNLVDYIQSPFRHTFPISQELDFIGNQAKQLLYK